MPVVTVSSRDRIVIPEDVREKLGIRAGQKLEVSAVGNRVELVPIPPPYTLRGIFPDLPPLERDPRG